VTDLDPRNHVAGCALLVGVVWDYSTLQPVFVHSKDHGHWPGVAKKLLLLDRLAQDYWLGMRCEIEQGYAAKLLASILATPPIHAAIVWLNEPIGSNLAILLGARSMPKQAVAQCRQERMAGSNFFFVTHEEMQ
jgi:hypothetical protein